MNRLTKQQRSQILHLLCEGNSIRAVTRLTGASKNTVSKLMIEAGRACLAYHDEHVRNLKSRRVQVDEIWSFTYAKQKNVARAKAAPEGAGDTWTWTAIDADYQADHFVAVAGRDSDSAIDVHGRSAIPARQSRSTHQRRTQAYLKPWKDRSVRTWTMRNSSRFTARRRRT